MSDHPTVAQTTTLLAEAMKFRRPPPDLRVIAGARPVSDGEKALLVSLYMSVHATEVRQAIFDILVAVVQAQKD